MIQDPYKVLGIERGASQEEIKRAYRKKAKENHPDLHPNDPNATSRMNEINEAYDMLQNPEKYERIRAQQKQHEASNAYRQGTETHYSGSSQQNQSYNSYRGPGGWSSDFGGFGFGDFFGFGFGEADVDTTPRPQNGDHPDLVSAIIAVNRGHYQDAIQILSRITSSYRNARWYYVYAVACYGMGNTSRAQDLISRAMQMDPGNRVYSHLYRKYRQEAQEEFQSGPQADSYESPLKIIGKVALGLIAVRFIIGFMQMMFYSVQFIR